MTQISTPTFFQRPLLMSRIGRALELPLFCMVAPIGYGKTLTAREALPSDAVWQTLVSDSPALFWEKVGAFLRPFSSAMADRIAEMGLPSTERELDELLSFFDTFSFKDPVYFVLYALGYISYTKHMQSLKERGSFSDFFTNYENEQMYRLLDETVYRTCTDDEKKFLLAMCQMDAFTLGALDFIMERIPDLSVPPRQVLQGLLVSNSFVYKNTLENRYEIHPILLFFLRKRLKLQTRKVQDFLYTIMGDWYMHIDSPVSAVQCYLEGRQYEKLLNLFMARQEIFNDFSNKHLLIRCFAECPISIKRKHILSCLFCVKSLLLYCEPALFKRALFEVQAIVNDLPPGEEKNWAQGELELLLAFTCFAELPEMYDHLMRATLLMGGRPSRVVNKDFPFGFGANALISLIYKDPGSLDEVNQTFAEIMPIYRTLVPGGGDGAVEILAAETAYCRGEWDKSYDLVHESMDKAIESDQTGVLLMGYHLLIQLALIHGDYRDYELVQKEIRRVIRSSERRELRHSAEVTQAGALLLSDGDLEQVPEWILHGRFYNADLLPPVCICAYMRYGRVLLAQKSYPLLLSFYRDMENLNRWYPSNALMIFADMYQAIALWAIGDRGGAEKSIYAALDRAMPDRIYIPFVQNLDYLEELLPVMERKAPDFVDALRRLHRDFERGVAALSPALTISQLFTDRENQIVTLLKRGYTNKQIAAELFIAEITVKKNLARIAEKLGVKGRMNILRALSENERRQANG